MKSRTASNSILRIASAMVLLAVLSSCLAGCFRATEKSEGTSTVGASTVDVSVTETSEPVPMPIPTYAPGTELYGMLSVTGEVVVAPKYEYLDLFSDEGLARFEDYGIWGFVNEQGDEVIPAQYEGANNFSEGLAAVKVDGLWGFIDTSGEMVIEPQFEGVQDGFIYGRCVYMDGNREGLIDAEGQVIVEPTYTNIELYSSEYFIVTNASTSGAMYGVIDRMTNVVVEMQADEIYAVTDSGFYFTHPSQDSDYDVFCNIDGPAVPLYTDVYRSSQVLYQIKPDAKVCFSSDGEKWGLFDLSSGTAVLEESYDWLWYIPGNLHAEIYLDGQRGIVELSSKKMTLGIFDNDLNSVYFGCFLFENHDRYGVKRLDGTIILEANYIWIDILSENEFYVVTKDKKRHIINERGTIIREIEGSVFPSEYVYSIECWGVFFEDYSEEQGIKHNDGFLSKDGETIVAIKCMPSRINDDCAIQYPNPIDLKTAPAIYSISKSDGTGGIGIMNPLNQLDPIVYAEYSWFPDQKVLVVSDRDGNNGLVCYDGTVLFELQDCHIFTNTGLTIDQNDLYVYETYNNTNFLIYTVEAD